MIVFGWYNGISPVSVYRILVSVKALVGGPAGCPDGGAGYRGIKSR